ncbi:hypothetical protein GA0004734_00027990 [Rhizobium sp. 9140]|nr:hypothetical protein GA0004734_00027990 [Rhizobium sp. 9140]
MKLILIERKITLCRTITGKRDGTMAAAKTDDKSDAAGLAAMIARAAGQAVTVEGAAPRGVPPVERWNPPFCGDLDMEIRADGTWFYMGTPIGRPALVRLFSTVLRKDEDGKTYLVTPVEKVGIRVVDAPFLAVEMTVTHRDGAPVLSFRTNVGDVVEAGLEHPLRFEIAGEHAEMKPYLHVRGRLEALVSRAVMYDLAALGEEIEIDGVPTFAVRSGGSVFSMMPAETLAALAE